MMYAVAALAGILFGVIYFGGLWLTIQKMGQMDRPILLLTGSFILRLALVMAGFYLVSNGRLELSSSQPDHIFPDPFLLHQKDPTCRGKERQASWKSALTQLSFGNQE
jgi:F1F0 ATPase subunit 2